MFRITGWAAASLAAVLAFAGPVSAQTEEGKARKIPWSGYWWPHKQGLMLKPLGKYDQYVGKGGAAAWERAHHPMAGAGAWWGSCHAWSAAFITATEPRGPMTTAGRGRTIPPSTGRRTGLLSAAVG